jgi:signal transduction histidine kinase/ligand-binding sensor domain-containing protein/CheY-like chemotaxis protein
LLQIYRILQKLRTSVWKNIKRTGFSVLTMQNKAYKPVGIILLYLVVWTTSFAQYNELRFKHINTNNGLSNNNIRCIAQDNFGYIWIGTNEGLNRYDGYSNKVFKKVLGDSTSLSDNTIYTLYLDHLNNLWVGTQAGLSLYDSDKENFKTFILDPEQYHINAANRVTAIKEDAKKNMWVTVESGSLFYYDRLHSTFVKDTHNFRSIRGFVLDKEGRFWLGGYEGLYKYNREKNEIDHFESFTYGNINYSMRDITTIFDEGDILWVGTTRGRICYILKSSMEIRPFKYNLDNSYFINDIFKGRDGLLYFSTTSDLFVYNKETDNYTAYKYEPFNSYGISGIGITKIYEDNQGNIWVGTFQGGVDLTVSGKAFQNYNKFSKGITLDVINIKSILEDNQGNLWIGSFDKGINVINPFTGQKKIFMPDENNPFSLSPGAVFTIFEDSKHNIWTGTYLGYLQKYEPATGKFISFPIYHELKNNDQRAKRECRDIRSIIEDKEGNLWLISNSNGMIKFNPFTLKYKHFTRDDDNLSGSLADNWAFQLLQDHEGYIWVATPSGLSRFNPKTETFHNYYHKPKDSTSLCNNYVNVLYEDSHQNLWIGTSFGLDLFDRQNQRFLHFYEKDGLPSMQIKSILEHKPGELWISTGFGLSRMRYNQDVKSGNISASFRNYNHADDLQDNFFWECSGYKTKSGYLVFGSEKGIIRFDPDRIHDNKIIPKVYITGLKLFNKPVSIGEYGSLLKHNIRQTKEIRLKHNQDFFSIEFVAINYISNENNQYAYRLEGFDPDWIYIGNKREASYTNLDPGKYIFRVKASNNDGYWNEEGASITIVILPPFTETLLFRFLVALGIVSLTLSFFLFRINILKNQKILLEQRVEKRTMQLSKVNAELKEKNKWILTQNEEIVSQSHEISSKNTEISKQKVLLEEQKSEVEKAYEELKHYRDKLEEIVKERTRELFLAKEKAVESDRLKSSFLANLSHEIRTPLNSIIGFSGLIFDVSITEEERKSYKLIIESSSHTLLNLINDIIDFSKIEANNLEIVIMDVPLNKIFKDLQEIYTFELKKQQLFKAKQIEFRLNITGEIRSLVIPTDEIRLKQVLSNLVNNAIKFTSDGYIEVGCRMIEEGNKLEFYVKDTGIGIKDEYLEIIFHRFRKIEEDNENIYRGAGLGLAISQQLVRLLGGKIRVESKSGEGSVFYFTISINKAVQSRSIGRQSYDTQMIPLLNDKIILVAEDDYSNFLYIEKLLLKTHAKVLHATNGEQAVELTSQNPGVNLVLMDIKMPGMNGMEALKKIRQLFDNIPVVAQTAYVLADELKLMHEAGFSDYISKPIKPNDFYALLNKHFTAF